MMDVPEPWFLVSTTIVEFKDWIGEGSRGSITMKIDVRHGLRWPCPLCGNPSKVKGYETRRLRTLLYTDFQNYMEVIVPKLDCEKCKRKQQVPTPWARRQVH